MLVILGGALTTELGKTEGQLHIWEGEEATAVIGRPASPQAEPPVVATLPFAVRLDAFEVDYYEGTRRPAQFRSRVTVKDAGRETPAVIEMNRELAYGGYKFFQSSYRETPERDQTILSVSKDPGEPIVFLGYYTLVAGMIIVLVTRIRERRRALQPARGGRAPRPRSPRRPPRRSPCRPCPRPPTSRRCAGLPVQHDGRVMPFDTLAREAVWNVTGKRSVWGVDPAAMALGWAFDPRAWAIQPIVPVKDDRLAAAIGLPAGTRWSSFEALAGNAKLLELMSAAQAAEQQERPLAPLEKAAQKLEGRLLWMQQLLDQSALRAVPAAQPGEAWTVPEHAHTAAELRAVLDSGVSAGRLRAERLSAELLYNRARPTRIAWWVLTLSLLLSIAAMATDRRALDLAAGAPPLRRLRGHELGHRDALAGRRPDPGLEHVRVAALPRLGRGPLRGRRDRPHAQPHRGPERRGRRRAHHGPHRPAADRPLHPPDAAGALGHLLARDPRADHHGRLRGPGARRWWSPTCRSGSRPSPPLAAPLALKMAELQYFYIHVGSILLVAGILTGSMWAASSWGRYWGWDPKEVWSLVAFLAYMAILHARAERLIGSFGVAAWSIVAFQTILMTYLGVNFVLAAGLHSYGFGDSSVVRAMVATALVEAAFIGVAWARLRKATAT